MQAVELDIADPDSIRRAAVTLVNNAGSMPSDGPAAAIIDATALATMDTNLLGPIRMTSALIASEREEALVDIAVPMRNNAGPDEHALVNAFHVQVAANPIPAVPQKTGPAPYRRRASPATMSA